MENQWLAHAKRLQAIASTGMHFCHDEFDQERYSEVAAIANAMLSTLGNVPIERIEDLIPDFAKGYATPKVDVRGAVVENGAILLVRERSDGLWTLPGGFADIGRSAAQNVEKEVHEEAGVKVTARRLYRVRYKPLHSYSADVRDFYKMFFLCERTEPGQPCGGVETSEAAFFKLNELPPLSLGSVIESDINAALACAGDHHKPVFFD